MKPNFTKSAFALLLVGTTITTGLSFTNELNIYRCSDDTCAGLSLPKDLKYSYPSASNIDISVANTDSSNLGLIAAGVPNVNSFHNSIFDGQQAFTFTDGTRLGQISNVSQTSNGFYMLAKNKDDFSQLLLVECNSLAEATCHKIDTYNGDSNGISQVSFDSNKNGVLIFNHNIYSYHNGARFEVSLGEQYETFLPSYIAYANDGFYTASKKNTKTQAELLHCSLQGSCKTLTLPSNSDDIVGMSFNPQNEGAVIFRMKDPKDISSVE